MAFILLDIIAIFGCQVIQGFDLCKLDDLLDKKDLLNSITKYGTSLQTLKSTGLKFCRVDFNTARTTHCGIMIMMSP